MTIEKGTREELIRTHINVISALHMTEDKWLTNREKEFIVHCVVMKQEGFDIKNKRSVKELKIRMGFTNNDDVYTYRKNLKSKGWLLQTKTSLILPSIFDIFDDGRTSINYRFSVTWKE